MFDQIVQSWIIYYDDETTFDSTMGDPADAPVDGVQWIVEFMNDKTRRVVHGVDYYFWNGSSWQGGRINDLERWLRVELPNLKYGRWTNDEIYNRISSLASEIKKI